MRAEEVPAGYLPVRCLRCGDHLAVPLDTTRAERHQLSTEHHLYLCGNPTPNVRLWRSVGFPPAPGRR